MFEREEWVTESAVRSDSSDVLECGVCIARERYSDLERAMKETVIIDCTVRSSERRE